MATNRTIPLTEKTKEKLISMKLYPRETFEDILERLIAFYESKKK